MTRILTRNGLAANTARADVYVCTAGLSVWIPERSIAICETMAIELEYEDELAFVLAHEVAHILLMHCPGGNVSCNSEELARRAEVRGTIGAGAFLGSLAAFGGYGILVAAGVGLLENAVMAPSDRAGVVSLDRKDEEAADQLALFLMANAGYNVSASRNILAVLTKDNSVIQRTAISPDMSLFKYEQAGQALFLMDLLKEITESSHDLNMHPTGAYRIDILASLIRKNYQDAARRELTPLHLEADIAAIASKVGRSLPE